MEVTDVRIRKLNTQEAANNGNRTRAILSVTFDDELVVHDIKLIQCDSKLFVAMPSRKAENGDYKDITHPIKPSFRSKIQDAVLARYTQALDAQSAEEFVPSII